MQEVPDFADFVEFVAAILLQLCAILLHLAAIALQYYFFLLLVRDEHDSFWDIQGCRTDSSYRRALTDTCNVVATTPCLRTPRAEHIIFETVNPPSQSGHHCSADQVAPA